MPTYVGPNGSDLGLVFGFDTGDTRNSYLGEPTTNLIPNAPVNALPTYGNGWASYNTNQYCGNNGCAVYWDIPAVASVSNNIVTTVSAHQIRSFDVINPQTTGGGVNAGQNYLAKKISDTQFSLHAYNSSQDGSQGYVNPQTNGFKVHDSYWLDERVSINASGFPVKWWGSPHLPNSALVKEIIPGGFDVNKANRTNCVRLHWFRSDATDGMSYGVDASVTIGQPVTTSFWVRAASASAVGQYIAFQHYNYGGPAGASGFFLSAYTGALGEWVRRSFTFTPTHNALISYWFPSTANMKIDVANIQIEQKNHVTPFTTGSRTNTGSLVDLKGSSTVDLNNISYDANAQITFDGSDDYATISSGFYPTGSCSVEMVFRHTHNLVGAKYLLYGASGLGFNIFMRGDWAGNLLYFLRRVNNSSNYGDSAWGYTTGIYNPTPANETMHLIFTHDAGTGQFKCYKNGILVRTVDGNFKDSGGLNTTQAAHYVGGTPNDNFPMTLPLFKVYNKVLEASEVEVNYKGIKGRFNI